MFPHRLRCLNTLSPGGGAVWRGLGAIALLEEVCHWKTLRVHRTTPLPVDSLCFVLMIETLSFLFLLTYLLPCLLATMVSSLWNQKPSKLLFFFKLSCLVTHCSSRKGTHTSCRLHSPSCLSAVFSHKGTYLGMLLEITRVTISNVPRMHLGAHARARAHTPLNPLVFLFT